MTRNHNTFNKGKKASSSLIQTEVSASQQVSLPHIFLSKIHCHQDTRVIILFPPKSFLCLYILYWLHAFLQSLVPHFPHTLVPTCLSSCISHNPPRGPSAPASQFSQWTSHPPLCFSSCHCLSLECLPASPASIYQGIDLCLPSRIQIPAPFLLLLSPAGYDSHFLWSSTTSCLQKYMATFWH